MRKSITFFVLSLFFGLITISSSYAQTEMLKGGNMELETDWSITNLNSQVSATATWNYTTDAPAMGEGGNLFVSSVADANQRQYCIYQKVELSADFAYNFDGAVKELTDTLESSWIEVFLGTKPENGADYGGGQMKIAEFSSWNGSCNHKGVDGTFKIDGCHNGIITLDTTGSYYFVLKVGSLANETVNILIDELSLTEISSKPLTAFTSNAQNGYAPLTVDFTDESVFAESWAWNFGDDLTSTDQNPTHTYAAIGTYTVALTATNSFGDSTLTKTNYITVKEVPDLPIDGIIAGGNMEDVTPWSISYLNTAEGNEPTAIWNYTDDIPGAGKGGCLYVSGAVNNYQTQYCIYQEVTLSTANKEYRFNGAFKDISENLTNAWCEVFLGVKPVDGEEYNAEDGMPIASFSTWAACNPIKIDGTFQNDGCYNGSVIPDTAGTYYLVIKLGVIDWESTDRAFDMLIDQISLIESDTKAHTAFSADMVTGFAPLKVNFKDESKLADSWAWNFGDGNTSTEQNPSNTYSAIGKYTVSLTATNELGDSLLTKVEYITVNEQVALPNGEKLYGGNMENKDFWTITYLGSVSHPVDTWNNTAETLAAGEGGNLHLDLTDNSNGSQYCIWQAVELNADSAYTFDGAFRDLEGVNNFWCEVFIATVPPNDSEDFGDDSIKIAYFNTWEGTPKLLDGTFSDDGFTKNNPYQPEVDGLYYFVLKAGAQTNDIYKIMLDELTLKESTPIILPKADFFADVTTGESPLTVQFYNQSENAIEYMWYFGDGETSSESEPSHTYTNGGVYTVSLVAKSENAQDSIAKVDLISTTGIFDNQIAPLKMYPNPTNDRVTIELENGMSGDVYIYNLVGKVVFTKPNISATETIRLNKLTKGVYVVRLKSKDKIFSQKLIIK